MSEKKLEITSHHEEILKSFPELSKILLQMSNDQRISLKQYLETLEETWEESEIPIASELQEVHIEQDVSVSAQYLKKYDEYLQEQEAINNEQELIKNQLELMWFLDNFRISEWVNFDFIDCRKDDKKAYLCCYDKKNKKIKFLWEWKGSSRNMSSFYQWNGEIKNKKYKCIESWSWSDNAYTHLVYDSETGKEILNTAVGEWVTLCDKNNASDTYFWTEQSLDWHKYFDQFGNLLYEWENINNFYYDEASQQIAIKKYISEGSHKGKYVFEIRDLHTDKVISEVEEQDIEQLTSTMIGKRILTARDEDEQKQQQRQSEADEKALDQEKFCKIESDGNNKNIIVKNDKEFVLFSWGQQIYYFLKDSKSDFIVLNPERKNEKDTYTFVIFDQWNKVILSLPAHLEVSVYGIKKVWNSYSANVLYNNRKIIIYFDKHWTHLWNVWSNWSWTRNGIDYDRVSDNLVQENGRYRFVINFDKTQDDSLKDTYKIIDTETGTILEDNNFTTMHHVIREDDKIVFIVSKKATPEKKEVIILPIDKNSEDTSK